MIRRTAYGVQRIAFLVLVAVLALQGVVMAAEVPSRRLIEDGQLYDGRTVTYRGEAVTAVMRRGEYGWVNVNDGENAIGVWCPAALLDRIQHVGDYGTRGDTVEVVGVFNRACREHGGDLDIHADTLTVVKPGYVRRRRVDAQRIRLVAALFLATIAVAVIFRKRI